MNMDPSPFVYDPECLPDAPGSERDAPPVLHRLLRQSRDQERRFRPFDIDIDIGLVQTWYRECRTSHGSCCSDRYSDALSQHISELLLVDAERGCLVHMPSSTPFVALSYVWGDVPTLKTTTSNLEFLKTDGILFHGIHNAVIATIPATIRDAIYLVRSLGERYLWVDSLCVIQDVSPEEMNRVLQAMAHIYAGAEFTIAAAAGHNASYGIRGIGGPSRKRSVKGFASHQTWDQMYPENSPWARRGWTFQESLFSRRLLVFNTVASWLCGKVARHEWLEDAEPSPNEDDMFPDERPHSGASMGLMSLLLSVPCLGRWGLLVQDYSTRVLTFDEDAVRAFAGATNVMGSRFPGGMLHGLPVFYLDIALLWEPAAKLKRRPDQPSWSWAGWTGQVECQERWALHFPGLYCDTGEPSDWLVMAPLKPVATYHATTDWSMACLNGFYEYQAFREDVARPLPPGWTLHHHPEGHFYTKEDICAGESPYGYPLPDAQTASGPRVSISPILLCTTLFARSSISAAVHQTDGSIRLTRVSNEHAAADLFLCGSAEDLKDVAEGEQCHLIALSEAEVKHSSLVAGWCTYQCEERDNVGHFMYNTLFPQFYNVLWVQWEGGVAYRKALGLMSKKMFHFLEPELQTFQLG